MTPEATTRVAIVSGGTAGLGRAMVFGLLAAGHRVAAVGRNADARAELARAAADAGYAEQLATLAGDVRSPEDCATVVAATRDRFGRIDAVVNNAGLNLPTASPDRPHRFWEVGVESWRSIIDVNVNGAFLLAREAVPHLVAHGWGRIVNHVTSYRTMIRGGETPYGASKAALEAMTVSWAADLAGTGVTVNAILPGGASDTRMVDPAVVPNRGALVAPERMAGPIRWLLSGASDGVTGMRFIAADWDDARSDDENALGARRAGWPETVAASPARPWPPR